MNDEVYNISPRTNLPPPGQEDPIMDASRGRPSRTDLMCSNRSTAHCLVRDRIVYVFPEPWTVRFANREAYYWFYGRSYGDTGV